jgi:L-2-hydroxycarboxylate dehydrogenase (NAD+)
LAALIGGSLPTLRCRPQVSPKGAKTTPSFFFQVIHPRALDCGVFAGGRTQSDNVRAVIQDILGHGNQKCLLPGQLEHEAGQRSAKAGGLIFTQAEVAELACIALDAGVAFDPAGLGRI